MSGHSKWHNIQAKKGKADAARGKIFTKLGREIAVAAKTNPNPDTNSKLADVIAKAKAANMPNDNIERSIKRAAGELGDKDYKELTYEGYGVGGAAVIITTVTEYAIEAGAEDVVTQEDVFEIYTPVSEFSAARKYLEEKGLNFLQAEISMIPQNKIVLDAYKLETFQKMLDKLDENDDVQDIYHNVELPEEDEEE